MRPRARAWRAVALAAVAVGGLTLGLPPASPPPAGGQEAQLKRRPGPQPMVLVRIDSTGVEVPVLQVSVPYRALVFKRRETGFHAALRVVAVAQRGRSRVGGGVGEAEIVLPDYRATRAEGELLCEAPLRLRGEAPVTLRVTTTQPGTSRLWEERLDHRPFPPDGDGAVPLHFTAFSWNAGSDTGSSALLDTGSDSLRVRFQLGRRPGVPAWPDGGVLLTAEVRSSRREVRGAVRRAALPAAPAEAETTAVLSWPAAALPFGRLELAAWLETPVAAGPRLDLAPQRRFVNLNLPWEDDELWRRHVGWLEGVLDRAARQALARQPAVERAAAWRSVWEQQAGAGGARARDLERAHLLRVVEADDRFGEFGRGAQSDRGRIFIRYGPPDSVERRGDDLTYQGLWEIWYYHRERLMFTFFDAHGLGDFRLTATATL